MNIAKQPWQFSNSCRTLEYKYNMRIFNCLWNDFILCSSFLDFENGKVENFHSIFCERYLINSLKWVFDNLRKQNLARYETYLYADVCKFNAIDKLAHDKQT